MRTTSGRRSTASSRSWHPTATGWRCASRTPTGASRSWRASPGRTCRLLLLRGARRAENPPQPFVALVAGVLEDRVLVVAREPHPEGPRLHPRRGVVEGDRPLDRVLRGRTKALDRLQPARGTAESRGFEVVRALDHQRVAFPMAARIAHVRLQLLRQRLPCVERDDARLV